MKAKYLIGSILFLILLPISSCDKLRGSQSGELLLSSQFDFELATLEGYNFESGSFVSFPSATEILPDIVVDQFRLLDGSIKPGFSSPSNMNGFALAGSFTSLDSSDDFFKNELKEVDTSLVLNASSDTVKVYQVWILKTSGGKYAKILVRAIEQIEDEFGKFNTVKLDYVYQPDGTNIMP